MAQSAAQFPVEQGTIEVDVSDIIGNPKQAWIRLLPEARSSATLHHFETGRGSIDVPAGGYTAQVYVEHAGAPFLVDSKSIEVDPSNTAYVLVSLAEGLGARALDEFDRDNDLALDRVELAEQTDPDDPNDVPGYKTLTWPSPVLDPEEGWYAGDLQTFSEHSIGQESVERVVRRAERAGLDFLAITDRNTLDAARDPDYVSKQVVTIPAMEWGTQERGYVMLYAPRYEPDPPAHHVWAQGLADKTVQQGGVYAVAHPMLYSASWQWKAGYFNAVQVWCADWRTLLPASLNQLDESLRAQRDGEFLYPIARAAMSQTRSGNGKAELFWEHTLATARPAAAIAGSHYREKGDPIGAPVTWVFARNKSLNEIMRGIRLGRTVVSRDLDAPRVDFLADVFNDGSIDVLIGGVVPLRVATRFIVTVRDAKDKRLEVLQGDQLIRSAIIHTNELQYEFIDEPKTYTFYRIRITETADPEEGYGFEDLLVMTSAIYAREIVFVDPVTGVSTGINVKSDPNQNRDYTTTGSEPPSAEAITPR